VVSENHSTNDAPAVLSEFKDARLRIVKPAAHLSLNENFAFCFAQTTGEYIIFLNSDDLLHPDCCTHLAPFLNNHPKVAFAYAAVGLINAQGRLKGYYARSFRPSFIHSGLQEFQRYIWGQQNVFMAALIRRTAFEEVGGVSKDVGMIGDWYLSMRLLLVGDVAYCSEVLGYYRDWNNPRWSAQFVQFVREVILLYERLESGYFVEIEKIEGGSNALFKARKRYAISLAETVSNYDLSLDEMEEAVRAIRMLNNSVSVRIRLFLVQAGLGPVFSARRKGREWLRQNIKKLLFPRPSGGPI